MNSRLTAWSILRSDQEDVPYDGPMNARRSHCFSWMLNSWANPEPLGESGGTEVVTIGVPDDFSAVRVGFANVNTAPWRVTKVIACASSSWNDFFNPLEGQRTPRNEDAWSTLTFQHGGKDSSLLVTARDAPAGIVVAGSETDPSSGATAEPEWTFTDWVPCDSIGIDPATGMRVLMLRALIPGGQTITYMRGMMTQYGGSPAVNKGYGYFVGGLKRDMDLVTNPVPMAMPGMTTAALHSNHLVNGRLMALVQVMTRHGGITGMICGDSHQSGATSTSEVNNFLTQSLLDIGETTIAVLPIGVVCTAVGGLASRQIFPRMTKLLKTVRPAIVVMPGWSANEYEGEEFHASAKDQRILFARMLLAAEDARDAGAIPIFVTPFPRDAPYMASGGLPIWLAQRDMMLAMRASGALVLDATPLLSASGDGHFTGTYLDGLSTDSVHPNDAGHAVVANALVPLIRGLIGLSRKPVLGGTGDLAAGSFAASDAEGGRVARLLSRFGLRDRA